MAEPRERQHTRVGDASISGDRKTEFYTGYEPAAAAPRVDNRKIVGALISYTWLPSGRLYEVRQGRTHIGAGDIRGENRPVEVSCPQDEKLSGDHAMILVQGESFYVQDLASSNGTILNGAQLRPEVPEPLPSPAEIKVGETIFTFVRFDATPAAQATRVAEPVTAKDPKATTLPR